MTSFSKAHTACIVEAPVGAVDGTRDRTPTSVESLLEPS